MLRLISVVITVMLLVLPVYSQHQNIMIGDAINSYEPNEPSIVISPFNTNDILVGANIDNYYYSTDSGYSWQHGVLTSSHTVNCDPCVLIDNQSRYYFVHLANNIDKVICQRSDKLGGTWNDGSFTRLDATKDNDKEWAVYDRENNTIYLTWSQFDNHGSTDSKDSTFILFTKSTDYGNTWETPKRISDKKGDATGGNGSMHAPMPEVGPDGEVYVVWWSPQGLMFDKSTDRGNAWLARDKNLSSRRVNWLVSVPGIQIMPGFAIIKCDKSGGKYNGNIYITWCDQTSGSNDTNVWLIKSTDDGETWSDKKRVNDDPAGRHQFFVWMDVDQVTGNTYFVFYDRRNYTDTNTDVYMAMSTDGCENFTNFKISESPFIPNSNTFFGHYNSISAYTNVVRPAWTRLDNTHLSLMTAIVDPSIISGIREIQTEGTLSSFEIESVFPNPFNPSTVIRYEVDTACELSLTIYDTLGDKLAVVLKQYHNPGTYEFSYSPVNIPSGVYLLVMDNGIKTSTSKIILLK